MSKENKSSLNQPDSVCCTGQQRWFEGRNVRFEEWGQSVRMFSNKVKEVQSRFSEFDCSHAGLESRLESQRSSLRSASCRDSPTSSADESVMMLAESSSTFQLHLAWSQLWGPSPGTFGIEAPASLELSPESRRLSTDRRRGPAPMRGSDVVISVYVCECGVPPWEVKLDTR